MWKEVLCLRSTCSQHLVSYKRERGRCFSLFFPGCHQSSYCTVSVYSNKDTASWSYSCFCTISTNVIMVTRALRVGDACPFCPHSVQLHCFDVGIVFIGIHIARIIILLSRICEQVKGYLKEVTYNFLSCSYFS